MNIQQEPCPSLQLPYVILTISTISALIFCQHEWALKLWKNGDAPTKEAKKSFVQWPWAAQATQHLSKNKWQEIYKATQEVVASVDNDFNLAEDGENSDNDDPSELVQISNSEAKD